MVKHDVKMFRQFQVKSNSEPIWVKSIFLLVETASLSYAEKLLEVYDVVETFVMSIGYPHSSHSLVGAILHGCPSRDYHPHQYDVIKYWNKHRPSTTRKTKMSKYHLFYELHQLSREQAGFGIRSKYPNGKYQARGKEVIKRE